MKQMKASTYLVLSLIALTIYSCGNKGQKSLPTEIDGFRELNVAGVKVLYKYIPNQTINLDLFVKGGTQNYGSGDAGIEYLAFKAATETGSQNLSPEAFKNNLIDNGIVLESETAYDYSRISMRCLNNKWNLAFSMMKDIIQNPGFNSEGLNVVKDEALKQVREREADPFLFLTDEFLMESFRGSSYNKIPWGDRDHILDLSPDQLRSYFVNIINRNRTFVVLTGDLPQSQLETKLAELFMQMPVGPEFLPQEIDSARVIRNGFTSYEADILLNHLLGITTAPKDPEERVIFDLALNLLQNRLHTEFISNNTGVVSLNSQVADKRMAFGKLEFSTATPLKAIEDVRTVMKEILEGGFSGKEVRNAREVYITQFYLEHQTNADKAEKLGEAEVFSNWRSMPYSPVWVSQIEAGEVNKIFRTYARNIKWYYLGSTDELDEELFTSSFFN